MGWADRLRGRLNDAARTGPITGDDEENGTCTGFWCISLADVILKLPDTKPVKE